MKIQKILALFAMATLASCYPAARISGLKTAEQPPSRIAFAWFSARQAPDSTCAIRLDSLAAAEGSWKKPAAKPWLCPVVVVLEDAHHMPVDSLITGHPLVEELEWADEKGLIQKIINVKDSSSWFLRFPINNTVHFIHFRYSGSNGPSIETILSIRQ